MCFSDSQPRADEQSENEWVVVNEGAKERADGNKGGATLPARSACTAAQRGRGEVGSPRRDASPPAHASGARMRERPGEAATASADARASCGRKPHSLTPKNQASIRCPCLNVLVLIPAYTSPTKGRKEKCMSVEYNYVHV